MAVIAPIGIDAATGQNTVFESGDMIPTGANDFSSNSYAGGNISIGTSNDGSFADVDATNAKITFTVNLVGKYLVFFSFSLDTLGTTGVSHNTATSFMLTDGTNNSKVVSAGALLPGVTLFASGITNAIQLKHIFDFQTTGSKTIKLQKKNTVSGNVATRQVLANSNSEIAMFAVRVSD